MMPCVGKSPFHCRRFVYGYSLDGSDFPCYFLSPHRTQENNFWLLESQTHRYVDLSLADFLQPLGIRHFYDACSLNAEVSIRTAALDAFQFQESDLSSDLLVSADAACLVGGQITKSNQWIRMLQRLIFAMYLLTSSASAPVKWTATPPMEMIAVMIATVIPQVLRIARVVSPLLPKCPTSIPC